jgi:DNA invertase Pin-like site-specific DNA recombinase
VNRGHRVASPTMLGYVHTGPYEGPGVAHQQAVAIRAACVHRGWRLIHVSHEQCAGSTGSRDVLAHLLRSIRAGRVDGLVVAGVDRLGHTSDLAYEILDDALRHGWVLAVLDIGVDLSTADGPAHARESLDSAVTRDLLAGARRREALAEYRAAGGRLGRPRVCPDDVLAFVVALRKQGQSYATIGSALNEAGIPTPAGGPFWHKSHVWRLLHTQDGLEAPSQESDAYRSPRVGEQVGRR